MSLSRSRGFPQKPLELPDHQETQATSGWTDFCPHQFSWGTADPLDLVKHACLSKRFWNGSDIGLELGITAYYLIVVGNLMNKPHWLISEVLSHKAEFTKQSSNGVYTRGLTQNQIKPSYGLAQMFKRKPKTRGHCLPASARAREA